MSAYVIVKADVTKPDQYKEYAKLTPAIVEKYHGQFIVRGGRSVTLEGPDEKRRIVVIEFPSLEKAQEWYHSKEYQEAKKVREGAAHASFVAVEGV